MRTLEGGGKIKETGGQKIAHPPFEFKSVFAWRLRMASATMKSEVRAMKSYLQRSFDIFLPLTWRGPPWSANLFHETL